MLDRAVALTVAELAGLQLGFVEVDRRFAVVVDMLIEQLVLGL